MEMFWIQILVIAFGNMAWMLPLFFWIRTEANADRRDLANLIREYGKETQIQISAIRVEIGAMNQEMKDFHGRLCAIEERRGK